jgi:hypothetical protein
MTNQHLPVNLAVMGVKQKEGIDLNTIWLTPYPIIKTYRRVCSATGLNFLGKGGSMIHKPGFGPVFCQGEYSDGYVLSGYRSKIINGNAGSMHRYAMALDSEVHSVKKQIEVGRAALEYGFTRVGFYPDGKFMHLDMAPDNWIVRFAKRRFWVEVDSTKQSFDEIDHAIGFMVGT